MGPNQFKDLISQKHIRFVDLRFMDFPGSWQHITVEAGAFIRGGLETGVGFDGSCVRGWAKINEGDMLLVPSYDTAVIDPFFDQPTVGVFCDIKDPAKKKRYSRDPRSVARKAEQYLMKSGIADEARFAPEVEFFVFDRARYAQHSNKAFYEVDSIEGAWNTGLNSPENKGTQLPTADGRFPIGPQDSLADLRGRLVDALMQFGVPVVAHHHEVASGGQCEVDLEDRGLLSMADHLMSTKYVVKHVAERHGKVATFMPKPLFGDNGSGMHTHFSLLKEGESLFAGRRYGGLSQTGLYAIGGILKHGRALAAFTNPTTNSYKRLVKGFEAPVNLVYSSRNRWSAVKIPVYSFAQETRRLEIRFPDVSSNPYLAFSAILMAVLDGIENKIHPGDPVDHDTADLDERHEDYESMPRNLTEALEALKEDHQFLLKGGVFDQDLINYWIHYKMVNEITPLMERPHPHEFGMYFNI